MTEEITEEIKLTFLGGATAIGASSAILEVGETTILVDAGIRFTKENPLPNFGDLEDKSIDAILITHAHSDHTGSLPIIHDAFPTVPIFMTAPTRDLVTVLQRDALKLMDIKEEEIPLYSKKQVISMLEKVVTVEKEQTFEFKDIKITYSNASHILGACMIHLETPHGNVLFSGDYSVTPQKSVPDLKIPKKRVDLFITESTYGNRLHSDRKTAEQRLLDMLREVVEGGGKALIPAFAIGRAQEVLLILKQAMRNGHFPKVPVFVDGMVRAVCNVYSQNPKYLKSNIARSAMRGNAFFDDQIKSVDNKDRDYIAEADFPCIIVSSSGMLSGGPSAFYAEKLAKKENNAIIITGYQDEESPGRALLNLASSKEKKKDIILNGRNVEINCRFESYSLSAHADKIQMSGLIRSLKPKTVLLVHGDLAAKEDLKRALDCNDVESCSDGQIITRKYKRTRAISKKIKKKVSKETLLECIKDMTPPYSIEDLTRFFIGDNFTNGDIGNMSVNIKRRHFIFEDPNEKGKFWKKEDLPKPFSQEKSEESQDESKPFDIAVSTEQRQTLKMLNPRGKILEYCQKNLITLPKTYVKKLGNDGFVVKASTTQKGVTYESARYFHISKDGATAAAYYEILEKIPEKIQEKDKNAVAFDARSWLSAQKQVGKIREYDYEVISSEGPPHAMVFKMKAYAVLNHGKRIESEVITTSKKKEGQKLSANSLHKILGEQISH